MENLNDHLDFDGLGLPPEPLTAIHKITCGIEVRVYHSVANWHKNKPCFVSKIDALASKPSYSIGKTFETILQAMLLLFGHDSVVIFVCV